MLEQTACSAVEGENAAHVLIYSRFTADAIRPCKTASRLSFRLSANGHASPTQQRGVSSLIGQLAPLHVPHSYLHFSVFRQHRGCRHGSPGAPLCLKGTIMIWCFIRNVYVDKSCIMITGKPTRFGLVHVGWYPVAAGACQCTPAITLVC